MISANDRLKELSAQLPSLDDGLFSGADALAWARTAIVWADRDPSGHVMIFDPDRDADCFETAMANLLAATLAAAGDSIDQKGGGANV